MALRKIALRKSRLWAARDNYNAARATWLDAHQKAGWTINNRAKKPEYNDMYQSAKRNYENASRRLDAETRMAQDYYKKRKSSQN